MPDDNIDHPQRRAASVEGPMLTNTAASTLPSPASLPLDHTTWTTSNVVQWLRNISTSTSSALDNNNMSITLTPNIEEAFRKHGITGSDLSMLEREDFLELGFDTIPQRRKIKKAVDDLLCSSRIIEEVRRSYRGRRSRRGEGRGEERLRGEAGEERMGSVEEGEGEGMTADEEQMEDNAPGNDHNYENPQRAPPQHPTQQQIQIHSLSDKLNTICPALSTVLGSFHQVGIIQTDVGYWHHVEFLFMLRILMARTLSELANATLSTHGHDPRCDEEMPYDRVTVWELKRRLKIMEELFELVQRLVDETEQGVGGGAVEPAPADDVAAIDAGAIDAASAAGPSPGSEAGAGPGRTPWRPLFAKVSEAYQLSPLEQIVLQFIVVFKISTSAAFRAFGPTAYFHSTYNSSNSGGGDAECTSLMIQHACSVSSLQLRSISQNSHHPLIVDRVLQVDNDEYAPSEQRYEVPDEVCLALLGEELESSDKLKLSGTTLLEVMEREKGEVDGISGAASAVRIEGDDGGAGDGTVSDAAAEAAVQKMLMGVGGLGEGLILPEAGADDGGVGEDDAAASQLDVVSEAEESGREGDVVSRQPSDVSSTLPSISAAASPDGGGKRDRNGEPSCYKNELDYLNDQFSVVLQQIQISNQRLAQDLKDADVDMQPRWLRSGEGKKGSSIGEMQAKLKLAKRKIEIRLDLTRKGGVFYPRLESLVDQLKLDTFEKSVLLYLAGSMISPIFKSSIESDTLSRSIRGSGRKLTVGDLLVVFCPSVSDQVAARTYFYRSATLIQKGLVRVVSSYAVSDLTDQELQLDRRVLDCIVGLDKETTEVSSGSHLYDPTVDLNSVVLSPKLKNTITDSVVYFDNFRAYRKRSNFDENISYGVGLTLMFCGPSGTGKTMTANAIAAKLGKKLLLVDFPRLSENRGNGDIGFQSIFREAELSDAIIFFDECELLFQKRSTGGGSQVSELLTELERFEGIVFLATNRPFDLDEAMYRRISEVFDFKPPNYLERLEIWKLLTTHESIPCEESIDWESISLQYELTGGFIKNAVLAALLSAVGRDPSSPMITQDDIIEGCRKQMRGALQMRDFDERVVPTSGLKDLIVSKTTMNRLDSMVKIEKARGILFGAWGFGENERSRQGTTALFWGPRGTGRSRAAEAVGFELGKPLKVVDLPQLIGRTGKANFSAVKDTFKEARLMDAVLVFDGITLDGGTNGNGSDEGARLLNLVVREMTRFPGVVIMMVETPTNSLDMFISRLDKGLLTGLKFIVEFSLPDFNSRIKMWEKALPESVPIEGTLDFKALAQESDKFNWVQIGNVVYRAAAVAALRPSKNRISMSDMIASIKEQKEREESAMDRYIKASYL